MTNREHPLLCPGGTSARIDPDHSGDSLVLKHFDGSFCGHDYGRIQIGESSTRELLEELRLRGDLAMTVMPNSERGADGAALSALAGALLKSSTLATLEAKRGE